MTVATNPPYDQYIATSGQTVFNYTFEIVEDTDLLVYERANTDAPNDLLDALTLNVDYTVTGVGAENGGTIILNVGATLSNIITIKQNVPVGRDTAFTPGGILRAQDLNSEFDNQTLIGQVSRFNEQSRMLRYWDSAIVVPYVDTIIPVLGANQIWAKNNANDEIIAYTVPAGGLAPGDALYLLQTPNMYLPNAFNMGGLASGLLKQSVSIGVATPAIATLGTDYYGDGMTGYMQAPVGIKDSDGQIILEFRSEDTNRDQYMIIFSGKAGDPPSFAVDGVAADIQMDFYSKGLGAFAFVTNAFNNAVSYFTGGGHHTTFTFANTAQTRSVIWQDASGTVAYLSDVAGSVTSAEGTAGQVLVNGTAGSQETGDIVLSLPQSIATNSDVVFNSLQLTQALDSSFGGTGVNNQGFLLGYEEDISFIGAYPLQISLSGATSIQFPTSGLLMTANLTDTHLWVGNALNTSAEVLMSGDATMDNTGAVTVASIGGQSVVLGGAFDTAGEVDFIGAYHVQFTFTAATSVQFPVSGLLATTADIPASILTVTGTSNQVLIDLTNPQNPVFSLPQAIDTSADVTFHSLVFSNYATGGIVGTTTNNAAASGFVGQVLQASAALNASSITSATPSDVLFLDLPQGDWQVWANIGFFGQATTQVSLMEGWLSTTAATNPGGQYAAYEQTNVVNPFVTAPFAFCVPSREIKVANSATQRVYLGTLCAFTGGTLAGGGQIVARRMR